MQNYIETMIKQMQDKFRQSQLNLKKNLKSYMALPLGVSLQVQFTDKKKKEENSRHYRESN